MGALGEFHQGECGQACLAPQSGTLTSADTATWGAMAQYSSQDEPERDHGLANGQDEVFDTPPTRLERLHSRGSRSGESH